ncbi:MAG: tetratricopeptide repeat protein [Proteobacteria bacterium]|nr:tetratricopeptide repeat protein [Pseudomonadota bacterium]
MNPEKLFNEAVTMQLSGNLEGAKTHYKKLLRAYPHSSEVLGNLAVIVKKEGQLAAAEQLLQRAVRANPQNFSALTTLANIALDRKDYEEARKLNDTALKIEPNFPDAIVNDGVLLVRENKVTNAEDRFWRAMQLDPGNVSAKINLANCRRLRKENIEESITMLKWALTEEPDHPGIYAALAYAYQDTLQFVKALEAARRAVELDEQPEFLLVTANALVVLGEVEEAIEYYSRLLKLKPDYPPIQGSYLFSLNYDPRKNPIEVFNEYKKVGRIIGEGKKKFDHSARPKIEGRKIRIGYSSPDLYSHVVTYFLDPILRNHDKKRFEVFAYANVAKPDTHTLYLKKYFDHWVDVVEMKDEEMAQRILDDKIDILIDLAGHTSGTRLGTLAMRPAPIQATYLGYGYTTGMDEIDYFIGDPNLTPEGCENVFSEEIIRLPAPVYAYNPPRIQIPDVQDAPVLKKGYITFGTMTRLVRLNDNMLRVWKRVLDGVPGSKLRLDQKPFEEDLTIERFYQRLERLGFAREQVEIVSSNPHWDGYHEFDISLDCWPHNTGTTIFDSLFSGVPVISKRDRPSVGCLSAMVLEPMGFGDWIANTEDEFVEKAVAMASNPERLQDLRLRLRKMVENSPFFDFKGRTRALENAYFEMVNRYNEERT